jgi:hypothetical protein
MTSRRIIVLAAVMALTGPAFAGSGNTLYLIQDSSVQPGLGNQATVDQTGASGSLIGTSLVPATQKGVLNQATLVVTGNGGTIQLYQDNAAVIAPTGNLASIEVRNGGNAGVVQSGDGNAASVFVRGLTAGALVTQLGSDNLADVDVRGTLAAGVVFQKGDGNTAALDVRGFSQVTYIQNGDGFATPNVPVTVWSNAGPVIITQTAP